MVVRIAFSALLLLGCSDPTPFESELWPGEGIPRFAAQTDHLQVHEHPTGSSPAVGMHSVNKGQEVRYSATRVRTTRPGLVTGTGAGRLYGRSLGKIRSLSVEHYYGAEAAVEEWPYQDGESFEYLQDRAEGTCLIRREGVVFEIEDCAWRGAGQGTGLKLIREPVTEWWIRVTDDANQPIGWLLVSEESVEHLPRAF